MSQQELLKKIIEILDGTGIQYMLTGSVASSLQGEPRSTHDIDMVIGIEKSKAGELDLDYLEKWVAKLEIEPLWKRLINEAETG